MTLDKSLRKGSRLTRSRNVLKRAERIEQLQSNDQWTDQHTAMGLPKVRVVKTVVGKKKKKEKKEDETSDTK